MTAASYLVLSCGPFAPIWPIHTEHGWGVWKELLFGSITGRNMRCPDDPYLAFVGLHAICCHNERMVNAPEVQVSGASQWWYNFYLVN